MAPRGGRSDLVYQRGICGPESGSKHSQSTGHSEVESEVAVDRICRVLAGARLTSLARLRGAEAGLRTGLSKLAIHSSLGDSRG